MYPISVLTPMLNIQDTFSMDVTWIMPRKSYETHMISHKLMSSFIHDEPR